MKSSISGNSSCSLFTRFMNRRNVSRKTLSMASVRVANRENSPRAREFSSDATCSLVFRSAPEYMRSGRAPAPRTPVALLYPMWAPISRSDASCWMLGATTWACAGTRSPGMIV